MTNENIFSADISNHRTGNSAGEGTLVFPMQILCAIAYVLAIDSIRNSFQCGERRENNNLVQGTVSFHNNILSKLYSLAYGFVHFPVAGNHFAAQVIQRSNAGQHLALQIFQRSTAAGGNVGNAFSQAQLFDSSNAVAAADNAGSTALGYSLRYSLGTLAECIHFKNAHRSVPDNHLSVSQSFSISLAGFRTDIQSHISLIQVFHLFGYMLGVGSKCSSHYQIGRQQHIYFIFLSLSQKLFSQVQLILFYQGLAHFVALCSQEGVSHTAADKQGINLIKQVADNADFVAYLSTADNSNKRMQRIGYSLTYILDFLFQQEACSCRQEVSYAFNRSVCAVRYTEAVIDIQVCQRSQLFGKFHVVLFLFLMETQVFQQQDVARLQLACSSLRSLAYAVRSEQNLFAQQLAQMLSYRSQRQFRFNLSFRTAEMCH